METLNHYMTERGLPRSLQVSIRKYYRYFWSRRTVFEHEEEILSDLRSASKSSSIRMGQADLLVSRSEGTNRSSITTCSMLLQPYVTDSLTRSQPQHTAAS